MTVAAEIVVALLASLGVALVILEAYRTLCARKNSFICICFREELLYGGEPDMLIICKSDAEQEEIIRRVCRAEKRKVYIKRW